METKTKDIHDDLLETTPNALREQALRRLRQRRDLKAHATVYTLVNLVVWGIWTVIAVTTSFSWPWPVFLTLFWGIGLAMNAWEVYFRKPITEAELEREVQRLQHAH